MHGRLGDAFHVNGLGSDVPAPVQPRLQALDVERLPGEDHQPGRGRRHRHRAVVRVQEDAKGGRRLAEDRDLLPGQQLEELSRRARGQVWHHDQPATVEERPPHLKHRDIERDRVEQAPDIRFPEAVPGLGVGQEPDDVPVGDLDALGLPGRARRVDHVGEVLDADLAGGVGRALFRQERPVCVEPHHLGAGLQKAARERLLGDQDPHGAVGDDEAKPILRGGRVEGQVRPSGLEDSQDPDQHLQGPLETEPDQGLPAHPQRLEVVREAVGPLVQLTVGQRGALVHQGRRVRGPLHLLLEEPVRARDRPAPRFGSPAEAQHARVLLGVEQWELAHCLAGILRDGVQQVREVASHARDGRGVEEVRVVLPGAEEGGAAIQQLELEIELAFLLRQLEILELQPAQVVPPSPFAPADEAAGALDALDLLHHEGDLDQRSMAGITRRLQPLHEQREGSPVLEGPQHGPAHVTQEGAKRRVAREVRLDHDGVDEIADHTPVPLVRPSGCWRADDDLFLPGVPVEKDLEGGHQEGEWRDPFRIRERLDPEGHIPLELERQRRAVVRLHSRTGPVRGQVERGRHPGQLGLPEGKEPFPFRPCQHLRLLLDVGLVGGTHRGQG